VKINVCGGYVKTAFIYYFGGGVEVFHGAAMEVFEKKNSIFENPLFYLFIDNIPSCSKYNL